MRIDVDKLREEMADLNGSAAFSGFPAAVLDLADVESADGEELCRIAERQGVDLSRFSVPEE